MGGGGSGGVIIGKSFSSVSSDFFVFDRRITFFFLSGSSISSSSSVYYKQRSIYILQLRMCGTEAGYQSSEQFSSDLQNNSIRGNTLYPYMGLFWGSTA